MCALFGFNAASVIYTLIYCSNNGGNNAFAAAINIFSVVIFPSLLFLSHASEPWNFSVCIHCCIGIFGSFYLCINFTPRFLVSFDINTSNEFTIREILMGISMFNAWIANRNVTIWHADLWMRKYLFIFQHISYTHKMDSVNNVHNWNVRKIIVFCLIPYSECIHFPLNMAYHDLHNTMVHCTILIQK